MNIIIYILLAAASILLLACLHLSKIALHPRTTDHEHAFKAEIDAGRISNDEYKKLEKQEISITSPYGYKLFGYFFPVKDSKKAIIICHGITWNLMGALKYMAYFTGLGFNVLVYDHRYHGKSGGTNTTFGYCEKYDLKAWTDWVINKCGTGCIVGTMGESLGAATALLNLSVDPRIAFCIADSSFSDLKSLLKVHLKQSLMLPSFPLVHISSLMTRLMAGMYYKSISPLAAVKNTDIPIFFIHGQDDYFIPKEMSTEMYNAKRGCKRIYIAPNAEHTGAFGQNRHEYGRLVKEFLEEIGML